MYELHNLGWSGFQKLCLTVVREILGQTVESFLDSNDGGQDGAFAGTWEKAGGEAFSGRFVIQCKFTARGNYALRLADLKGEVAKVKRLVAQGRCDAYVILTNAGVSGKRAAQVEDLFRKAGVKHVLILGFNWICDQIRENKNLRMQVPRLYGLGDLTQILDERAYKQATAVLASLREDLAKTVITDAYRKASDALNEHGFVLLIGEPAAGKTTIASLLSMAAIDQWNVSLVKPDRPAKLVERWNPDEPSQFFWLDDAFGPTQYEASLVQEWNRILAELRTMLKRGAKIVMTSRDYIYSRARNDLKEGAFPLLEEGKVVIDVHKLTPDERRQILYNHLKLGRQPKKFKSDVKPYLETVAAHPRFIPETARRLADPVFTKGLYLSLYHLHEFVEKREQLLREVLQNLDNDSKAALGLIYMRNDRLHSPIELQPSEERALARLGSTVGACRTALDALNGSLVQRFYTEGEYFWRFKHPTIGDAYASILVESPELLDVYVQGSTPEKLVEQVTCGDVGIEKAVVLPKTLFPLMLKRLDEFSSPKYKDPWLARWAERNGVQGFLTRRCSKEFLALYIEHHPDLLAKVAKPGLLLSAVPEVDLAARLHEVGLLPEERRKEFIATVSEYALDGSDLYALDDYTIRRLFEPDEFDELLRRVRTELVPKLKSVRYDWQSNLPSEDSPDGHMQPLLDSFEALKRYFADDEDTVKIVNRETELAQQWVAEHMPDESKDKPPRKLAAVSKSEQPQSERSIFDDVDA
jgi:energy-coupling factor transporter ATP-binding protein EcfA2